MKNKNLLIVYKDSKIPNVKKLENSFDITIIPKTKRVDIRRYKKDGNLLISKYNDSIFSTNADFIFFVCSSKLNREMSNLLKFERLEKDFSYFTDKKTDNLLEFLSGFVVKKDIFVKIGCFDRYVFHNLYLNFLVNYSRFFPEKIFSVPFIKAKNYAKIFFWDYLERILYSAQPLQKRYYFFLRERIIKKNGLNRIIKYLITNAMNFFNLKINKFIENSTYIGYW